LNLQQVPQLLQWSATLGLKVVTNL